MAANGLLLGGSVLHLVSSGLMHHRRVQGVGLAGVGVERDRVRKSVMMGGGGVVIGFPMGRGCRARASPSRRTGASLLMAAGCPRE